MAERWPCPHPDTYKNWAVGGLSKWERKADITWRCLEEPITFQRMHGLWQELCYCLDCKIIFRSIETTLFSCRAWCLVLLCVSRVHVKAFEISTGTPNVTIHAMIPLCFAHVKLNWWCKRFLRAYYAEKTKLPTEKPDMYNQKPMDFWYNAFRDGQCWTSFYHGGTCIPQLIALGMYYQEPLSRARSL